MNNTRTDAEKKDRAITFFDDEDGVPRIELPLEIRVHGRGGQGGVTCAKLCALLYSNLGLFAQTFGDYGMERAGAPVRAYTRVDRSPITNRNKVYSPGHLLILDSSLLGDGILDGALPGSLILLNTQEEFSQFQGMYEQFRFATVNATAIARKHGIGSASVVIVNTAIVGAYARLVDLPIHVIKETYSALGLQSDISAAEDAYQGVFVREARKEPGESSCTVTAPPKTSTRVIALPDHTFDMPTPLKTGSWRTQSPVYATMQAPCNAACPAGNDVVGFIQALKQNGLTAAARVLAETQPLPSVCGRVCPAPCMSSCNRAVYDGAVNIRGLERWVGDHVTEGTLDVQSCKRPRNMAIVGGGPAGLAAAFSLALAGHDVTVYETLPKLGGVLRNAIPAYRLPADALDRDIHRILELGIRARLGEQIDGQRVRDLATSYDAVVLATGQAYPRAFNVPGAELPGVEEGLHFLHRVKTGGCERLQGTVIVVGGGNTALDCARTVLRSGADRVALVYRRSREEMPAIGEEIEEAIAEGVQLVVHRQPVKFAGDNRVTGIELAEVELGEPDSSGRKSPIVTNRISEIPCDHVLLALGQDADLGILPPEWTVREGRAHVSDRPLNVWLSGDLTTAAGTVAHAVGHGRNVARRILGYVGDTGSSEIEVSAPSPDVVKPENIRFFHFPPIERHQDRHLPLLSRTRDFQEVNSGLADAAEAERCFSCGHCTRCDTCLTFCPEGIISGESGSYVIDEEYCKGCGICVWECPRQAMHVTAQGYRSKP
ncbi:MAG TPA: FAD-dependent oxidoreductase [Desulfomonilaceae bacterium]|nr:FAD-dependent oxidoreductase [Desulfomonilaceae bacterium]